MKLNECYCVVGIESGRSDVRVQSFGGHLLVLYKWWSDISWKICSLFFFFSGMTRDT